MRKSIIAMIIFILLSCNSLFAQNFIMISADDPILYDLRILVRDAGKSFLSLTPPLSGDEILAILDEIDIESLSDPMLLRYENIINNLYPSLINNSDFFSAAIHIRTALEGRFRSNTDIPWLKKDNTSQAMLGIPIQFFFADRVELFAEPLAASDPWFYNEPVSNWGTNVPWEAKRIDLNMPLRAYAAFGGKWWNFQIGRDNVSYGSGKTGNLALSNNPDYYEFARLSFFSSVLKYSAFVSQMPMSLEEPLFDNKSILKPDDLTETQNRYFYLHRIDIRFKKKFTLSLSEGVMVGNSPLELRYLNPLMIFHSFFSWKDYPNWGAEKGDMTGSILSLDFEWAFHPGWALYSQIVMNEFSTPYEKNIAPDQPPSGMGYLLGAEYAFSISNWSLSIFTEFVYTDPFLYTLSSPFASMIWMRRSSDLGTKALRYAWIGHGEGRDMFLAAFGISAQREKLTLSLDYSFKMQGEHGILWDWNKAQNSQSSPSGNPVTSNRLLLGINYKLLPGLWAGGHIGGASLFDAGFKGNREYGIETGLKIMYYY